MVLNRLLFRIFRTLYVYISVCSSLLFNCCRPGLCHFTWAVGAGLWRRMAAKNGTKQPFPSTVEKLIHSAKWNYESENSEPPRHPNRFFIDSWTYVLIPRCELHLWPFSPILFYISFLFCVCFCPLLSLLLRPLKHCRQFKKLKQSMQLLLPTRWNSGKQKASFANVLFFYSMNPGSHMPHSKKFRICEIFWKRNPFHLLMLIQLFCRRGC